MNSWEPRPLPRVTPATERYWRGAAAEELLVRECCACDLVFFYPRAHCPNCFGEDVEWVEADGTGTVYTYSVSDRVEGWPECDLPVVLAYVELDEGPRLMTNLVDCDPDVVEVGVAVEVRYVPTERDGVAIPVFTTTPH